MCTIKEMNENVNKVMNSTKKARQAWKKSYFSLSRLLRDTQLKASMKINASTFEAIGLPTTGKVKPDEVLALIPNFVVTKKGERLPAYAATKLIKDKDGNPVLDKDGNKTYDYILRPVREGQWTLDILVKVLASK